MRLRLVLSEAVKSTVANASTTIAATMTVLIGMFLLGLFIALGTWVVSWTDDQKDKLLVKAYLCTELTCAKEADRAQIAVVQRTILRLPQVASADFISKDEALRIQRKRTPQLVANLTSNPLPAAFEIVPRNAEDVATIARKLERAGPAGLQKVNYGKRVAEPILRAATIISTIVLIAVLVLLGASTLLIANTIRLSIFSRRREIEVMKLVGATNWFVRGPFMIEGLLCGLVGSLGAVLLLLLGKEVALPSLLGQVDYSGAGALDFVWTAAILVGVGLLLGAAGSGLTLRRFLKV
ncbi:MAG: ABC transporter permease [Actinobacteria bacterium]|nr:ABC transporter permease [Actinomycetota bacterium]